jgi:hypothetical protein
VAAPPTRAAAWCGPCGCYHWLTLARVAGGETLLICPVFGPAPYAAPPLSDRCPAVIAPVVARARPPRPIGRPRKAR